MEKHDGDACVVHALDWIVSNDTVVRPDLVVICGPIPERHLESPPAIVIEVLSDATRERDRTYKKQLYDEQGVAVYLMVDPETETIELLTRRESGELRAEPTRSPIEISICNDCHLLLDIPEVFKR